MAQPEFVMSPGGGAPGRKPKTNIYTILLIIALVCLLIGCLTMWLEIKQLENTFGGAKGQAMVHAMQRGLLAVHAVNRSENCACAA
jgi:hypothetical protein